MSKVLLVGKGYPDRGGIPTFLNTLQEGELGHLHEITFLNVAHFGTVILCIEACPFSKLGEAHLCRLVAHGVESELALMAFTTGQNGVEAHTFTDSQAVLDIFADTFYHSGGLVAHSGWHGGLAHLQELQYSWRDSRRVYSDQYIFRS